MELTTGPMSFIWKGNIEEMAGEDEHNDRMGCPNRGRNEEPVKQILGSGEIPMGGNLPVLGYP